MTLRGDGIAIMRRVEFPYLLPRDSNLIMKSNGWHLMLFHPAVTLENNQIIPIFLFQDKEIQS